MIVKATELRPGDVVTRTVKGHVPFFEPLTVRRLTPANKRGVQIGFYVHWVERRYRHIMVSFNTEIEVLIRDAHPG